MSAALQEITPDTVLAALQGRVGAANGITAAVLVYAISGRISSADERRLRDCVVFLRLKGHPLCSTPSDGYHIAANERELNATCRHLLNRAVTGLQQVAVLKQRAMPDLFGQLGLPLNDTDDQGVTSCK